MRAILSFGVKIDSVTCDGKQAILKAVRKADKNIVIQGLIVDLTTRNRATYAKLVGGNLFEDKQLRFSIFGMIMFLVNRR